MWITAASKRAFDVNFREGRLLIASGKLEFVLCIGRHQTHPSFPKLIDTSGHLRLVKLRFNLAELLLMAPANPYAFILANVPNTASPPRKTTQRSKIFLTAPIMYQRGVPLFVH